MMWMVQMVMKMTVKAGDDVTFTITVYNQGEVDASNIELTDYIPTGLILNDAAWTQVGGNATYTISGPLAAMSAVSIDITFTIDPAFAGQSIQNNAEISQALDAQGNVVTDVDSTPDNDAANDGNAVDNEINNTGNDEDDADFAVLTVTLPELCGVLACNNNIQISLGSCELEILPDMLLESPTYNAPYEVMVFDLNDTLIGSTVTASHVGEPRMYKVTCGENSCWGTVTLEYNLVPQITNLCEDYIQEQTVTFSGDLVDGENEEILVSNIVDDIDWYQEIIPFTVLEDCQDVILDLDWDFKWNWKHQVL